MSTIRAVYILLALAFSVTALSVTPTNVSAADPITIQRTIAPGVVGPGQRMCFGVIVNVNEGNLLQSRGDMLRNTDGNLYGHWPHIAVEGVASTGDSYSFTCYEGMIAPTSEGVYESRWRVWRDGAWVGPETTISFEVRIGAGGEDGYSAQSFTEVGRCAAESVTAGAWENNEGVHYYIDYYIPGSSSPGVVVKDSSGQARVVIDDFLLGLSDKIETVTALGPGSNNGDPSNLQEIPADHWYIFIPETFYLRYPPEPGGHPDGTPGIMWNRFIDSPGSLAHLLCRHTRQTEPRHFFYPFLTSYSIAAPQTGDSFSLPFFLPQWMLNPTIVLRKSSDAILSLRSPSGTIYGAGHPAVSYTNTPDYAMLDLDYSEEGEWELLVDVSAAEPDSVFQLSAGGKYGSPTSPDSVSPFTTISLQAAEGDNSWLVSDVRAVFSGDDLGGSGIAGIEWSLDAGESWQEYTEPVVIRQEGLTTFSTRSIDNAGNLEILPPVTSLWIDKTRPVPSISTDASEYTRTDGATVAYSCSDNVPGSGVASCTATFSEIDIEDGETLDLFWLDLTVHTVIAKAIDWAGWSGKTNTAFQIIATQEGLRATVARLCEEGHIKREGICNSFVQKVDASIASRDRGELQATIGQLQALRHQISALTNKDITTDGAALLIMDLDYILEQFHSP